MPTFTGDGGDNPLNGGSGDDVVIGLGGSDTINGGGGNDILYGHSAGGISGINSTVAASGFSIPVGATATSGDPGFLYVCEKETGVIWRVNPATGAKTTFLDIPNDQFSIQNERGVLGVAFHPDYEHNGRFFVYLTNPAGDIEVREYHRSTGNPLTADSAFSVIIQVPHPGQSNHNGGWLGFSPVDGYLYIGTGDGGSGDDPPNNAQNLNVLLGKILRIDVDHGDDFPGDGARNYHNPSDNPFVGLAGADEIWAYGVRNPFRMGFDPRNGDLYIGDVGQSTREEIDYHAATAGGGFNFGWRIMEGTTPHIIAPPPAPQPGDPSLIGPVHDYDRTIGTTVTGGEVYVGANPDFVGQYVFADFGSGRLFSLSVVNGVSFDATDRTSEITGATPTSIVDFVTGTDGSLYALGIGGTIWRLDPIAAADGNDTINGGDGNDRIYGAAGNDNLTGGADADTLNGGSGVDTANYAGASTASSWHRNPDGSWTITAGSDGTDTLSAVERAHFSDRDVMLDNARQSFFANGTSDLLWRNNVSGAAAIWEVAGAIQTSATIAGGAPLEWSTVGSGDFNGDGRDDILWRNETTGGVAVWLQNGASSITQSMIGGAPGQWDIAGVGDFNFDGKDDLLWHNNVDGAVSIWLQNGTTSISQTIISGAPLDWSIAGVADFNGDGSDDILLRQSSGTVALWTTNGVAQTSATIVASVPTNWVIAGAGDFDSDGRADILWRNTTDGAATIWRMDGATPLAVGGIGAAPNAWHIANVGDYNGDGKDDIVWRHDDGSVAFWLMNGFAVQSATVFGVVPTEWELI